MYPLIGLIQFLLMLTQSRLMPAMQGLWETKAVVAEAPAVHIYSDKPGAENQRTYFYTTPVTGAERKQIPRQYHQFFQRYRVGLAGKGKPFVFTFSSKLYLVFCQLKTEG